MLKWARISHFGVTCETVNNDGHQVRCKAPLARWAKTLTVPCFVESDSALMMTLIVLYSGMLQLASRLGYFIVLMHTNNPFGF
jgi:hypothetical protein